MSPPDLPPVSLYRKMGELLDLVESGAALGPRHSFESSIIDGGCNYTAMSCCHAI